MTKHFNKSTEKIYSLFLAVEFQTSPFFSLSLQRRGIMGEVSLLTKEREIGRGKK